MDLHFSGIDSTVAHPARRYNYWLGGKDNFAADRESGDAIEAKAPHVKISAQLNRAFHQRVVRRLSLHGVRQFLDIGCGLPAPINTHEIALSVNPDARVVYVDNDPLVLTHARALLTGGPEGSISYIDADLRDTDRIIGSDELRSTFDLNEPVAVLMVAVLHFIEGHDEARMAVRNMMKGLPLASLFAISHATYDFFDADTVRGLRDPNLPGVGTFTPRTRDEVLALFDGNTLLPPGVGLVTQWHPDPGSPAPAPPEHVAAYGGVAITPGSNRFPGLSRLQ